jgi:alpha-ketoglutarate-dependent taurine dioxygenase
MHALERDGYSLVHAVDLASLPEIARALGQPIPDPRERVLVKDIRPQPKELANANTLSSRYGMGAFPFHTEAAYLPIAPRFLLVYCVDPGIGERPTLLLDGRKLLRRMPSLRRPATWLVKAGRRPFLTHALTPNPMRTLCIRYDRECLFPRGPAAQLEENIIRAFIAEESPITIDWHEADLLIIDNTRLLHARGSADETDRNRWLKRVLVGVKAA